MEQLLATKLFIPPQATGTHPPPETGRSVEHLRLPGMQVDSHHCPGWIWQDHIGD